MVRGIIRNRGRKRSGKVRTTIRLLTEIAQNLTQAMTTQVTRKGNIENFGDVFKKVAASKPPTYDGKEDPASLENWLREFDKLFDAINCPEDLKINNDVYYLREEADLWWSQRKKDLMAKPDFDWETMKEALRAKFYPPYLKKQKCLEVTNLRMGTMTVNEYYTKFIELMRFAPEIVPTEAIKAQRFEQGLTLTLQGKLGGVNFESLDDVYGRAAHLYGIKGKELDGNSGEKRKGNGNFQGNEKKPKLDGDFNHGKREGKFNQNREENHNFTQKWKGNYKNGSNGNKDKPKRNYFCKSVRITIQERIVRET
ncbi:uncharacterized protein [Spinacia oleracea]|uniref:Retrotransposon gag domain-containing protein n=1 Tax=Spinacia oleracea TaxID=3562 RepID=A0A9R0JJ16_SPIOL|nr:uncharacterized protein LOC110776152 [Spinacia oleracea]